MDGILRSAHSSYRIDHSGGQRGHGKLTSGNACIQLVFMVKDSRVYVRALIAY